MKVILQGGPLIGGSQIPGYVIIFLLLLYFQFWFLRYTIFSALKMFKKWEEDKGAGTEIAKPKDEETAK
ncbi:MAG: hypothetical protein CK532_01980 [Flavobacteriales bacterium]|nr:MAG: hypothetical protein CK532_01980 [Flavobacteriales bacterium]